MDIGIIERQDGGVDIVRPANGFTVQDNFDRMQQQGIVADESAVPSTRVLRDAWVMNQISNGVVVDVSKAKEIVIGENEKLVASQLKAIRPAWEEAVDNDDNAQIAAIKSDRQNIRNTLASKIAAINACTTAAEVEAYLP